MQDQHIIEDQSHCTYPVQGIVVPLDLPGLHLLKQNMREDGTIEVHVAALTERETCPSCGSISEKIRPVKLPTRRGNHFMQRMVLQVEER